MRGAEVRADNVDTQVESGRAAGAGEHVAIVHIEHIGVDRHRRVTLRPAGRRSASGWPPAARPAGRPRPGRRRRSRSTRSRAPRRCACRSAVTSAGDGSACTSATPGTMTVSAPANAASPYRRLSVARPSSGTGPGGSAQIVRSYQSTSNSGRGRPNTSVTMPSSNADMPSKASTATRGPGGAPAAGRSPWRNLSEHRRSAPSRPGGPARAPWTHVERMTTAAEPAAAAAHFAARLHLRDRRQ